MSEVVLCSTCKEELAPSLIQICCSQCKARYCHECMYKCDWTCMSCTGIKETKRSREEEKEEEEVTQSKGKIPKGTEGGVRIRFDPNANSATLFVEFITPSPPSQAKK